MTVYLVAQVKVHDDSWVPDYAAKVHDIVAKHGGKYLARSSNITTMEGTAPHADMVAIVEFPSLEAVEAFGNDPDYAPFGEARRAGTDSAFYVIDDTDAAGSIPYLTPAS